MNGSMDLWGLVGGIVGGTLGSSAVVLLIATTLKERWIERVRADYAKELEGVKDLLLREQKALQARVDRSVFVSKAQFDAEFNAMRDIYRYATEVSLAMDQVRSLTQNKSVSPSNDERLVSLELNLEPLRVSFNQFSTQMSVLRPFYPEELSQCRKTAWIEIDQIMTAREKTFSASWLDDGEKNRNDYSAHYLQAAKIIRSRLDQLSVVPS